MDINERILEQRLKGYCCSETIMALALEDLERADSDSAKDLTRAMGAFCGGLHTGLACGTFCAALAAIYVAADDATARGVLGPEMTAWFLERFGAFNCSDLLEGDESRKLTLCPVIISETYIKLRSLFTEHGIL